jgi:hypothetical protein
VGSLFRRWVVAFTLGELIGFGLIPAVGGFLATVATEEMPRTPRALLLYAFAIIAGFGEGWVLARFQLHVLCEPFPKLDRRSYSLATGLAASIAWAAGMLTPTLDDIVGLPVPVTIALWVTAAMIILPSIGLAQARVLREHVSRPGRWVVANVVGWLVGLPWTFVLPAIVPDDAPAGAFVVAMIAGGTLMGASAGAVTGIWLSRMVRESRGA